MSVQAHSPLGRLFDRFIQWRQRQADLAIAAHFGLTGGHITDEIERRISERLIGNGGFRS